MISDFKDPAIRLFGRTIQLAANDDVSPEHSSSGSVSFQSSTCHNSNKAWSPSSILDHDTIQSCKSSTSTVSEEEDKALKKPTKILQCPRCSSADTKFCYFNNYNVKQPRHFCKGCQRYWTAGGSMRKMTVGAGRRKHKNNNNDDNNNNIQNTNPSCCIHQDPATISFHQYPIWGGFMPVPFHCAPTHYWGFVGLADSPLGKHPRDEKQHHQSTLLVPKTLRFDDPSEAAQSPIWNTPAAFFGGFDSKADNTSSNSRVLQANPAALSRSLTFHETTA